MNISEKIDLIYNIGILHTITQFISLLIFTPIAFILLTFLYSGFEILLLSLIFVIFLNFLIIPFFYTIIHNYFIKRFELMSLLDKAIEFLIISFISSFFSMVLLLVVSILFPNFELIKYLKLHQNLELVFNYMYPMFIITFISEFIRFEFFDKKGL